MFWKYNTTSPQIDIILCKEDLTLHELLDQENVLQELKAQNLKLIEFLIKPDVLCELVTLITTEPSPDTDLSEQYRYPNLACELLTSDLPALNERLASEEILNKLYRFLQNDPPLNPLLSSYFSRTLSILISRKSEQNWFSYQYTCLQALEFLKAKQEFIELLLKHMGTSAITDLLLNLVTLIEGPELKQSLWNWLQNRDVIPSLISLLGPKSDPDCQMNAASLLCNIIQKLRENLAELNDKAVFDPILHLLESSEITKLLLNTVFSNESWDDTSIQSGVDVLLTLIHPYLPGDARCRQTLNYTVHDKMDSGLVISNNNSNDNTNDGTKKNNITNDSEATNNHKLIPPSEVITAILPFIKKFKDILTNPPEKESIKLTCGTISRPFGKARFLIAKLIAMLISLRSREINEEIIRCDILELLLNLFYAYSSNNFLHTEVEKIIAYAIDNADEYSVNECGGKSFLIHLFKKCELLKRILDMWLENLERESDGHSRRGYMGHVIRIATLIHIETGKNRIFNELLVKESSFQVLSEWNTFVKDKLIAIIEKHSTCLGGVRPKLCQSSDNSFEESVFNKELKSEYKDFGQDDDQNIIFSNDSILLGYGGGGSEEGFKFSNGSIEDEEEQLERQTRMFDLICAQKWHSFTKGLDNLPENDEDSDNGQSGRWREIQNWDSDDENVEEAAHTVSDPWSKLGNISDPWASSVIDEESDNKWNCNDDVNWAKFDENFIETFPASCSVISDPVAESCSTSAANNTDAYNSFGSGRDRTIFENLDISNNFADVKMSSSVSDQAESPVRCKNHCKVTDEGNWVGPSNEVGEQEQKQEASDSSGYIMRRKYNCFNEHDKDALDQMLNLESISGNTLAEKIANAENDIRNKDEEEHHHHHHHHQQQQQQHNNNKNNNNNNHHHHHRDHQRAQSKSSKNNFEEMNEIVSCNDCECDIRLHLSGSCDEPVLEDENEHEQNGSYFSHLDCLTENSFDFVTAENSTSDAESSIEFADAENSLELEEEDFVTDRSCVSPSSEFLSSPTDSHRCDETEMVASGNLKAEYNNVEMRGDAFDNLEEDKVEAVYSNTKPNECVVLKNDIQEINAESYDSMNGIID